MSTVREIGGGTTNVKLFPVTIFSLNCLCSLYGNSRSDEEVKAASSSSCRRVRDSISFESTLDHVMVCNTVLEVNLWLMMEAATPGADDLGLTQKGKLVFAPSIFLVESFDHDAFLSPSLRGYLYCFSRVVSLDSELWTTATSPGPLSITTALLLM